MSRLAELQRSFLRSIVDAAPHVYPALCDRDGIARELGLGIYTHAYRARLREVLGNDHAVLAAYLGDRLWDELCEVYIAAHPSGYRSLRNFGGSLPAFVAHQAPFREHAEIAELALFERTLLDCFDAADAQVANWQQLQSLSPDYWPALRPRLAPSVRRLSLSSNAVAIWIALKAEQVPPKATTATRTEWLCWRDGELVTRFRSIDVEEAALIDHFLAGGDFSEACELLLNGHAADAVPARALAHLARWSDEFWISDWRVGDT